MALSPDDVRKKQFNLVKKGYDRGEVNRFLDEVATELATVIDSAATVPASASTAITATIEPDVVETSTPVAAEEIVEAETVEPEPQPEPAPAPEPEPAVSFAPTPTSAEYDASSIDNFDRVGNEISLMLRQAQESALKIRTDAEVEARTLVDQVRLDIEADRAAHESAATELIQRTEERATHMRSDAENYATETRRAADEYAAAKRDEVDEYQRDAEVAADADRRLAAEKLESAKREAEAMIANANQSSEQIIEEAKVNAEAEAGALLGDAQSTIDSLADAESQSRENLERARTSIEVALASLKLSEINVPGNKPASNEAE